MTKGIAQRQRIGPQIRHLRQLRNLTLDDLASAAGLSASHLSRLERSQTLPSFTVLANIAQVLDVSIDEFVQLEHDLQELDEQLAWQADLLALDENAHQEILGLSIDTRRQLNHAIDVLSKGSLADIRLQEEISVAFSENKSFDQAYAAIKSLLSSGGQNAVGLSRSHVQLNAIPGPRIGVLTSPGLSASAPNIDYAKIYRGLFPHLPLDPSVAQRWKDWYSYAADEFPFDWPFKIIVSDQLLTRIQETYPNGDEMASKIAQYWKMMLDNCDQFEIAISSRDLGRMNMLVAGRSAALFEHHEDHVEGQGDPVGLWVSGTHLVRPVIDTLEGLWKEIPDSEKDRGHVRQWLEQHSN